MHNHRLLILDIDECASDTLNTCSPDADCKNTEGDFICQCPFGFHGDGRLSGTGCDGECMLLKLYRVRNYSRNTLERRLYRFITLVEHDTRKHHEFIAAYCSRVRSVSENTQGNERVMFSRYHIIINYAGVH